jgi:hypothetical protein
MSISARAAGKRNMMESTTESAVGHSPYGALPPRHLPPPRPSHDGEQPPATDDVTPHRWSRASVVTLTVTGLLLAGALVTHLAMIFLTVAPPNALKVRHREMINSYVQPEFGQQWKLFAPNPKQRNDAIGVRLRTTGEGGTRHSSDWINLTAQDLTRIQGHPAPSHVDQNLLRTAWDNSENWHTVNNRPKGIRGVVAADYLKRIVLQRVGRQWHGERITAVRLAGRYTMVQPPSWSSEDVPDTTTYRMLPWWPVTDQDYKGL